MAERTQKQAVEKVTEYSNGKYHVLAALVERIGYPAVITAGLLYGGYSLLLPLTKAHIETLGIVQEQAKMQALVLDEIRKSVLGDEQAGRERTLLLQAILKAQEQTTDAIKTIPGASKKQ